VLVNRVLSVQKVLSGSGRAGRLRLVRKFIGHRLVARPKLDNTFWTDSTSNLGALARLKRYERYIKGCTVYNRNNKVAVHLSREVPKLSAPIFSKKIAV